MSRTAPHLPSPDSTGWPRIAVIGAGIAGAACAGALARAGAAVTVFDKSRGVGGRMATRCVQWVDGDGAERSAQIDHGAAQFDAHRPRFRAAVKRAEAAGCVAAWRQHVYAAWPNSTRRDRFIPVPNMPALCRHLLADVPLRAGQAVQRLHRAAQGWLLALADGSSAGPFDQVMLAMPPAQAALLLAGHQDEWADALAAVRMAPCWTLMAVTDDVDWPWDAAEPERGPLALVLRNDRKPGRDALLGLASWTAHATPAWSAAHLEDDAAAVIEALRAALQSLLPRPLPGAPPVAWRHVSAHRWRYALPPPAAAGAPEWWWDASLGLGVCGDAFGTGTVEAAWCSGDELADNVAAWLEAGSAGRAVAALKLGTTHTPAPSPLAQGVH
jgi:renalase